MEVTSGIHWIWRRKEFFDYISETTGLKFQETAKLVLKTGKASEPAKAERD